MRLTNSKAKCEIWNCSIKEEDNIKFNKNYSTLKEMGDDLGMTYSQITDLKNKRSNRKQIRFKFHPEITITRIKETQKEHYDKKRAIKQSKLSVLKED